MSKLYNLVHEPFFVQWQEAETAYKNAVAVCNECQYQVHVSAQVGLYLSLIIQVLIVDILFVSHQKSILCAYRRQVMEFDIQLRDVSHFKFIKHIHAPAFILISLL